MFQILIRCLQVQLFSCYLGKAMLDCGVPNQKADGEGKQQWWKWLIIVRKGGTTMRECQNSERNMIFEEKEIL